VMAPLPDDSTQMEEPMAATTKWRNPWRRPHGGEEEGGPKRKTTSWRELIDTATNKLFVCRNACGTSFKKVVDAGRSIAADKRQKAKRKVPSGRGDRGDRALCRHGKITGAARATIRVCIRWLCAMGSGLSS